MKNEGPSGFEVRFNDPGYEQGGEVMEITGFIKGFTESERKNFEARILSQIPFPDLQNLSHPVYEELSAEERTALQAASQPSRDAETVKRAVNILDVAYDKWFDKQL